METWTAAVTLFLILDPLGNLPVVVSILKSVEAKRRKIVLMRELIFSLMIMFLFLFAGQSILDLLGLQQEAVTIAGGIILFLIALRMIFPTAGGVAGLEEGDEPFLVPLAIPMIAGPSVLAALLLMSNQDPTRMLDWSLAVGAAWGATAVILLSSGILQKVLGTRGLTAMERLMGMVLVMISVQMLLDGIKLYFGL
jgi:multiple antibiotic resistance protein